MSGSGRKGQAISGLRLGLSPGSRVPNSVHQFYILVIKYETVIPFSIQM